MKNNSFLAFLNKGTLANNTQNHLELPKISEAIQSFNKNLSFVIENLGCQMNLADANEIKSLLKNYGYKEKTEKEEKADIVIFNSCAIRESSENRLYAKLDQYSSLKKKENFLLIVMGCVAQKEGNRILERLPNIDLVIGTHEKFRLPEILEDYYRNEKTTVYSSNLNGKTLSKKKSLVYDQLGNYEFTNSVVNPKNPFQADIIIIHGCDKYCSYCIVPYTRGQEMSQKSDQIINTAKRLVEEGVTEITLLGQNVNSYGKDIKDISFANLLYALNDQVLGLKRIRFLTSHPMDFGEDLINAIAECDKVCNYVHLPIQSASDFVLKKMRRDYTYAHYLSIIDKLRAKVDNLVLSTDLLVGFPYETESDFLMTYDALDRLAYDHAYMFKYSKRRGAEAAAYEHEVPEDEKKRRLQAIIDKQRKITQLKNEQDLGKIEEILLEGPSRNNPEEFIGKTAGNKPVIIKNSPSINLAGKYLKVLLKELKGNTFIGEIILS